MTNARRQVMAPFVLEALMMTIVGGLLGTGVALGLMGVISILPLKGEASIFSAGPPSRRPSPPPPR